MKYYVRVDGIKVKDGTVILAPPPPGDKVECGRLIVNLTHLVLLYLMQFPTSVRISASANI